MADSAIAPVWKRSGAAVITAYHHPYQIHATFYLEFFSQDYLCTEKKLVSTVATALTIQVSDPVRDKEIFYLLQNVQTGSRTISVSYSVGTRIISFMYSGWGVKFATPTCDEFQNEWSRNSDTPPTLYIHDVVRERFVFSPLVWTST
jgi:hypothetical protein